MRVLAPNGDCTGRRRLRAAPVGWAAFGGLVDRLAKVRVAWLAVRELVAVCEVVRLLESTWD
jgi:hypothetical protein